MSSYLLQAKGGEECAHAHVEAGLRGDHLRLAEVHAAITRVGEGKPDSDAATRSRRRRGHRHDGRCVVGDGGDCRGSRRSGGDDRNHGEGSAGRTNIS